MGWSGTCLPFVRTRQQLFEKDIRPNFLGQVIDYAIKGSVIYVAVRQPDNGKVEACVVLTRKEGAWWYTKYIDEGMGPREARCPLRILRLLSPTDHEWALEWRQRCYKQFKRAA